MSSLFRRGKVYWAQLSVRGKRRRISLRTTNHGVATSILKKMDYESVTGGLNLPTATPPAEILEAYAATLRSRLRPKSAQSDLYRLAEFFGPVCPALTRIPRDPARPGRPGHKRNARPVGATIGSIEEVNANMVDAFLTQLARSRGLSPKTLNEYREILQRFFNWAIKTRGVRMIGEARHNPVTDVARYRVPDNVISFLTLPQIREQLQAVANDPLMHTLVATYILAGLRREEALWLCRDDVDLEKGRIHIRAKTVAGEQWFPKTRRNRIVPISAALLQILRNYTPGSPWYFPSPNGRRWDPDNFSQDLAARNAKAGLRWSCLDFRHTFGSQLAQRGESLYKISQIMGNSPEVCRRHYAALTIESLQGCVDFLLDEPQPPTPAAASEALARIGPDGVTLRKLA